MDRLPVSLRRALALVSSLLAFALAACVVPPPQPPDRHLVILTTAAMDMRVTAAQLVYGRGRPMEMAILGMGGAGEFHRPPVPPFALVSWTDTTGHAQERRVPLREQVPSEMAGRTLQFEIHDSLLKVFVDTPSGHHDIERRLVYSD